MNRRRVLASIAAIGAASVSTSIATQAQAWVHGVASGGAVPASVASPVVGTDLTAVWNLQFGGTGPRSAFTNGAWSGSIDAYLTSVGFVMGNDGALYLGVGSGSAAISHYDFTNSPDIHVNGSGSATFTDCTFAGASQLIAGTVDINGNYSPTSSTLLLTFNFCKLNTTTFTPGTGGIAYNYCRFTNQKQQLGGAGFNVTTTYTITFDHCYITGGGCAPAPSSHVELLQAAVNPSAIPGSTFSLTNTLVDISKDGQPTQAAWGGGWTGLWGVIYAAAPVISGNILIGLAAVNANPANPNAVTCIWAFDETGGGAATFTNNVMEAGTLGYVLNQNAGPSRCTNAGGNRSFTNAAITTNNFV